MPRVTRRLRRAARLSGRSGSRQGRWVACAIGRGCRIPAMSPPRRPRRPGISAPRASRRRTNSRRRSTPSPNVNRPPQAMPAPRQPSVSPTVAVTISGGRLPRLTIEAVSPGRHHEATRRVSGPSRPSSTPARWLRRSAHPGHRGRPMPPASRHVDRVSRSPGQARGRRASQMAWSRCSSTATNACGGSEPPTTTAYRTSSTIGMSGCARSACSSLEAQASTTCAVRHLQNRTSRSRQAPESWPGLPVIGLTNNLTRAQLDAVPRRPVESIPGSSQLRIVRLKRRQPNLRRTTRP